MRKEKEKQQHWTDDWPLTWLVWSPKGIIEYLKDANRFYQRFQEKPTRQNIIDVIKGVVGENNIHNRNMNTVQNFASHYNGVMDGSRQKGSGCNCAPLEKTSELIKIFAIHKPTRIEGLEQHIRKLSFEGNPGFFSELVDNVQAAYEKEVDHLKDNQTIYDLLDEYYRKMSNKIDGITHGQMSLRKELEKILKYEKSEYEKQLQIKSQTIEKLKAHFEKTPDDQLRSEILKYFDSLQ